MKQLIMLSLTCNEDSYGIFLPPDEVQLPVLRLIALNKIECESQIKYLQKY